MYCIGEVRFKSIKLKLPMEDNIGYLKKLKWLQIYCKGRPNRNECYLKIYEQVEGEN